MSCLRPTTFLVVPQIPPTSPHLLLPDRGKGAPPALPLHGCDKAASAWTSRSLSLQAGGERVSSIGGFGSFPPWQLGKGPMWWGTVPHCPLCLVPLWHREVRGAQPLPEVPHKAAKRAATAFGCLLKERGSLAFLHYPPRQSPPPPALQPSLHCEGAGLRSAGLSVPHLPVLCPTSPPQRSHLGGTVCTPGRSRLPLMKSNRWV